MPALSAETGSRAQQDTPVTCSSGFLPAAGSASSPPDLLVTGECHVKPDQTYYFENVNVLDKGRLVFDELDKTIKPTATHFWVQSMVIENGGTVVAGSWREPYGNYGGVLTIHLYGVDRNANGPALGALCRTAQNADTGPCGVPTSVWNDNGKTKLALPGGVSDFFYRYGPLHGDGKCSDGSIWSSKSPCDDSQGKQVGYFGYKVLAVSYGGSLELWGSKGSCNSMGCSNPQLTHPSWTRLDGSLSPGAGAGPNDPIVIAGPSNFNPENLYVRAGDQIVVTTTDYLPGHSETFVVKEARTGGDGKGRWLTKIRVDHGAQWHHNGERYALSDKLAPSQGRLHLDPDLVKNGVETRAAVAILNRSIRIVSGGDGAGEEFPASTPEKPCVAQDGKGPCYSLGGHVVFRQGFNAVHIKGVEFKQLGQGGRMAHYPVHFHMARQTPAGTYVRDSSINESMTRWIVLHSTQGVLLAGNVGYKSIGHGFYLEDGTETDNKLYGNLGILARAAVANAQNPRLIPGILAANEDKKAVPKFPYLTDSAYPSVFWITNGWNEFIGNMAAGATACGSAYWFVPAWNSDRPDVMTGSNNSGGHMKWSGYAGLQKDGAYQGSTPLKAFVGNFATSTMMSFQTTGDAPDCSGVVKPNSAKVSAPAPNVLTAVRSLAPDPNDNVAEDHYYPHALGGNRHATACKRKDDGTYDCEGIKFCDPGHAENCAVTVIDKFTSMFHWAQHNVAAIWLRNQWYLVANSVLSDVQNGGLTFITGGDYTHASVIRGYWALARKSVFIGHTQPQDDAHAFALDAGPFNARSKLRCDWQVAGLAPSNYCLSAKDGISIPLVNFDTGQRLFNIYDGPAYQDSNAYFDITKSDCPVTGASTNPGCMYGSGVVTGVTKDPLNGQCYLPNAAIGWKQSNGFFYPPAFHSTNLYFSNVDIRHFVFDPLFQAPDGVTGEKDFGQGGTYITATSGPNAVKNFYCTSTDNMFDGWSGIDRQTELTDDDGTLTGLISSKPGGETVSINEDQFFTAKLETSECRSNLRVGPSLVCPQKPPPPASAPSTAKTSPYDYVATAIAPECSQNSPPNPPQPYGRCGDSQDLGQGGEWSSECSNGACYGVPLFRQYLTTPELGHWQTNGCAGNANTPACRWPFMRMGGQNMYQRETLTVNNGLYYVDTSISKDTQNKENYTKMPQTRDVNVFAPGQTYYMFFLYAKPTTAQTYQIYVGDGFDTATVKPVRGSLATAPIKFSPDSSPNAGKWFTVKGVSKGIVTIETNFAGQSELDPKQQKNGLCGPASFCGWKADGNCGSKLAASDPRKEPLLVADPALAKEADAVCKTWAVKDLDCPSAGCFGFSFTLPAGFSAQDQGQAARPAPIAFPETGEFATRFLNTKLVPDNASHARDGVETECFYPRLPGSCPAQ
ncbi:G8 domain-containing protein [Nitrobacter hamburgensis]|uniref:G8 domain-containing protein n=1 Tax=Nitrobacter hamburgensis TaxID=912 RepID=UPI0002FD7A94|nr:G8 domain-containing protein [Nitrobacter hamburgensis]